MKTRYMSLLTAALLLSSCGKVEMRQKSDSELRAVTAAATTTTSAATAASDETETIPDTTDITSGTGKSVTTAASKTEKKKTKTTAAGSAVSKTTSQSATGRTTKATTRSVTNTSPTTRSPDEPPKTTETPQTTKSTSASVTREPETSAPDTSQPDTEPVIRRSKQITVRNISQYPELPTGCETTSLAMLLNYYGIYADKVDIAREHLPKQEFYWQDGQLYGADFRTTFAGDPEDENSYGCYAPCIVTAGNSYLEACGSSYRAEDVSGQELETLLTNYIDNDMPVLIWITYGDLHEPAWTTTWLTPSGEQVQWYSWEHCTVLTGYDYDEGLIYVSDPIYGITSYNMELLKLRYDQFGRQCVCII